MIDSVKLFAGGFKEGWPAQAEQPKEERFLAQSKLNLRPLSEFSANLVIPWRVALQQSSPPLNQGKSIERQVCQLKTVSKEGFTPFSCGQFVDRIPSMPRILNRSGWDGM